MEAVNRKLIRPSLNELKEQIAPPRRAPQGQQQTQDGQSQSQEGQAQSQSRDEVQSQSGAGAVPGRNE